MAVKRGNSVRPANPGRQGNPGKSRQEKLYQNAYRFRDNQLSKLEVRPISKLGPLDVSTKQDSPRPYRTWEGLSRREKAVVSAKFFGESKVGATGRATVSRRLPGKLADIKSRKADSARKEGQARKAKAASFRQLPLMRPSTGSSKMKTKKK